MEQKIISAEQAIANKMHAQATGLRLWVESNYRGTLEWATGVGKTKGALLCLEHVRKLDPEVQTLIVTPSEEMRDTDWVDEFEKWKVPITNVKLICYASLAKEKLENYGFVIYDEGHRLTLPNLKKLSTYHGKVLCLTATLPKDAHEDLMERVNMIRDILPPVHTITTDEAVDLGLIADFEVSVLGFFLDPVNKNIPGGSKAKPFMTSEKAAYDYLSRNVQKAMYSKNEAVKFMAISKRVQFLYNLPSKTRLALSILEHMAPAPDNRTVLFCGSIEQANRLCNDAVYHSESTDEALKAFQEERIHQIATVRALNEGKNLINVHNELIVQVDSQDRNLIQRIGRAVRRRNDNPAFKAKIIILVALNTADEKWFENAIRDFQTKRIKRFTVTVPPIMQNSERENAVPA